MGKRLTAKEKERLKKEIKEAEDKSFDKHILTSKSNGEWRNNK